jgi:hypothetical protein
MMKSWLRQTLVVLLLGACLVLLFRLAPQWISKQVNYDDFVEYWAAGRLNLEGSNPYSPEEMLPLELQTGRRYALPLLMYNPPWTLPLVMPFGVLNYPLSRLLWFAAQTALIFFCASYIWKFYHGPPNLHWLAWVIAFTFLPTLFVLKYGQISAVMLLGAVFFLMVTRRQVWWLAGLALLCLSIKPHTLYLLVLAFFVWVLSERRWPLLVGSAGGIFLATGIAVAFNPLVLKQYFFALDQHSPIWWATPTIGGTIRYLLSPEKKWLQFLPTVLGVIWFGYYWWKRRRAWNWPEQVPLLVMVSVLTAAYGWTYDYVVLVVVILSVAAGLLQRELNWTTVLAIAVYLVIDGIILATNLNGAINNEFWLMWLAPGLAAWYFLMIYLGVAGLGAGTGAADSKEVRQ